MTRIRWWMCFLVLWLVLVFNIERPTLSDGSNLNLSSMFYVLVALTVVVLLYVPMTRTQLYATAVLLMLVYAIQRALLPPPDAIAFHRYILFTEIVILLGTIWLTWKVGQELHDFQQAIEAISLPVDRPRYLPYEQMHEQIDAEMRRARRHQHPLSVAMITLKSGNVDAALHRVVRDAQAAMIGRYVRVRVGTFLSRRIREGDVISHHVPSGRFLLVAPQTPADQTAEMLQRVSHEIEAEMGVHLHYSIADFPAEALTSEELIRRVTDGIVHRPMEAPPIETSPHTSDLVPDQADTLLPPVMGAGEVTPPAGVS